MEFKINVTKEVYEASKFCSEKIGSNCAIAKAVAILFPNVFVESEHIYFFDDIESFYHNCKYAKELGNTKLPFLAQTMIKRFDKSSPKQRVNLPEFSFTIDISDELLEQIVPIDADIKEILKDCKTLELV